MFVKFLLDHHISFVTIQMHNYPDADAIASAYGLKSFLEHFQINSNIIYFGKTDRVSSMRLISFYQIEMEEIQKKKAYENIITVDCQPGEGNVYQVIGNYLGCIDHHPDNGKEYPIRVMEECGSCSSLIVKSFLEKHIALDKVSATILLYGIRMDTINFTRGVQKTDLLAYQKLFNLVDEDKLSYLLNSQLSLEDLKAYGEAISNIEKLGDVGFSYISFDCPDGLIASLSEFILSIDGFNTTFVFSVRENGIKISVRTNLSYIHAGDLIRNALSEIGSGGGHRSFSGGFIPKENLPDNDNEHIRFFITNRFFKEYRKMLVGDIVKDIEGIEYISE